MRGVPQMLGSVWLVAGLLLLPVAGCHPGGGSQRLGSAGQQQARGGLSVDQRRRADELISAFENSTVKIQYDYAENLGDGRGVTSGRAGFTTATCDALEVITRYDRPVPDNPLARFAPELHRLCDTGSGDTSRLPEADYVTAWKQAANDPQFRAAQDQIVDLEYYQPAMHLADRAGIQLPLARAELYDAAVQHGVGDDPDGLSALITRTISKVGPSSRAGQVSWLTAFLDVRIADLQNPADRATAAQWRDSIGRVQCVRRIAQAGNYNLNGPLTFTVYSDQFSIP